MTRTIILLAAVAVAAIVAAVGSAQATPRGGALHVTKECSQYHGAAGEFCTIRSSNIPAIKPGMRVVYSSPLAFPLLNSDLVLDGPGNNNASGHVTLNLETLSGVVAFSSGTGRFSNFQARVDVTYHDTDGLWHWDGAYSLS